MIGIILYGCLLALSIPSLGESQNLNGALSTSPALNDSVLAESSPFEVPSNSNSIPNGSQIACFVHPTPPAPERFRSVTTSSCNSVIANILMDPGAMAIIKWKMDTVPRTWISDGCSVTINTQDPRAEDIFQIALIARTAAFVVKECVTDWEGVKLGGKVFMGLKHNFNLTVIGTRISSAVDNSATS